MSQFELRAFPHAKLVENPWSSQKTTALRTREDPEAHARSRHGLCPIVGNAPSRVGMPKSTLESNAGISFSSLD
jgi:hypothetical protein